MPKTTSTFKRRTSKKPLLIRSLYRSKLEERIASQLEKAGVPFHYEACKLSYVVPSRNARYTPDFPLGDKKAPKIVIEAKGRFRTTAERQKLVLVREQNPDLDLRIVFQNAELPLYKGSPTSYAKWADSHGILWADNGIVPPSWIEEMKDG